MPHLEGRREVGAAWENATGHDSGYLVNKNRSYLMPGSFSDARLTTDGIFNGTLYNGVLVTAQPAGTGSRFSTETRPKNVGVYYIIKY